MQKLKYEFGEDGRRRWSAAQSAPDRQAIRGADRDAEELPAASGGGRRPRGDDLSEREEWPMKTPDRPVSTTPLPGGKTSYR
jgi:hypothetical protein